MSKVLLDKVLVDPTVGVVQESKELKRTYLMGFVSSFLLLIASIGVGWIPPQGMWNSQFLMDVRLNFPLILASLTCIVIGSVGLMRAWLHLASELRPWGEGSLRAVKKAFYLWAAPLVFAFPLFSRDVYAYIAQGRLVQYNMNPYTTGTSAVPGWLYIGADPMWAESRTPYGPLFLFISNGIVNISGGRPEIAVLLFRIVALVGVALLVHYIPKVALLNDQNPAKALWLTATCPLFLFHFVISAHNDALMMGLLVAGCYYVQTQRAVRALLLLSLSIAIKPISLIAIPFFGNLWADWRDSWPERFRFWLASAVLALGPVAAMGYAAGWGIGWVSAFSTPGQSLHYYAPVVVLSDIILGLFWFLNLDFNATLNIVKNVALLAAACFSAYLVIGAHHIRALKRMFYAFTAIVLASTVIHPWYMLWLLVLWAITGVEYGARLMTYVWIVSFFIASAALDTMDISVLLQGKDFLPAITMGLTLLGIYMCVFHDHKTKAFFLRGSYPYAKEHGETIEGLQQIS